MQRKALKNFVYSFLFSLSVTAIIGKVCFTYPENKPQKNNPDTSENLDISLFSKPADMLKIKQPAAIDVSAIDALTPIENKVLPKAVVTAELSDIAAPDVKSFSVEKTADTSVKTDLEVFIHGGMCVSISGRCMLSNNMTNRDANRGGCAHSCRWCYDLIEDGKVLNPSGDYFAMSSKDLCAIRAMPRLMDLNINSFKIEGRMKSLHYIATVVNTYRKLIDEYETTSKIKDFKVYEDMILRAENRLTSTGFLLHEPTIDEQLYDLNLTVPTKEFVGIVKSYDEENKIAYIEQRNYFLPNSTLEVFTPKETFKLKIDDIYDLDGNILDAARHPKQMIKFKCDRKLNPYDLLRLN